MPNVDLLGGTIDTRAGGDYWFIYNNVLFMSINSNELSTAKHKAFLEKVIAQYGESVNWKVVTFHHSVYSTASHESDADIIQRRNELPNVFSDLGIDVVLMGHDHVYTRTYMMEGTTPVVSEDQIVSSEVTNPEKGQVLYITVNSASGSKYYSIHNKNFPYAAVKNQENIPNITNVEVTDTSFRITTYRSTDMSLVDDFTIKKEREEVDIQAPTLTIPADTEIYVGDTFDMLSGVSAIDNKDGDITDKIVLEGFVNTQVAGTYTITYRVEDAAGNISEAKRNIVVKVKEIETTEETTSGETEPTVDIEKPVINFPENTELIIGQKFEPMEGVRAIDLVDGDITEKIKVINNVDTTKEGTYIVTYKVADKAGNEAEAVRSVRVTAAPSTGDFSKVLPLFIISITAIVCLIGTSTTYAIKKWKDK